MDASFSLRRVKALIVKELCQVRRDISSILICVVLPLILLFIYGFGVSLDLKHLKIGLVLEDTSPTARSFAEALTDSPYFDVTIGRNRQEFHELLIAGKLRGIVIVPSYFTAFIPQYTSKTAPIQILTDGSEPNTANFVKNYVSGAYQNWLKQTYISEKMTQPAPVQSLSRFWYNEELESRNFLIPGSIALIMTLIGTLLTALVVAREWERGTMEALMSTPVTVKELLIGKLLTNFLLGLSSMVICTLVAIFFYNVPFRGSIFALFLVSSIFLLTALGTGLVISSISRNQFIASQTAMLTSFLPAFMLSGFIFEIQSMPPIIQAITYLLPPRYFVSALQTLFLVGDVWSLLIPEMIIMGLIGLLLLTWAYKLNVKRLD